jgi:hypothetical protein
MTQCLPRTRNIGYFNTAHAEAKCAQQHSIRECTNVSDL